MSEEERVVATWVEAPYTALGKRNRRVEHRVRVVHTRGVGTDVIHEVRGQDVEDLPDEWTPAEVFEGRDHGLEVRQTDDLGWFA